MIETKTLKRLLGLEETQISDIEIVAKLNEAQKKNLDEIEFVKGDGSKTIIRLPKASF